MKFIFSFFIYLLTLAAVSQNVKLYSTIYFPAKPQGGFDQLKDFFEKETVYPQEARDKNISGGVFITFKVGSSGKVVYRSADTLAPELLQREALRLFDKIKWEKDPSRKDKNIGFEKIEVIFKLRRYEKLVKKRGYDFLPAPMIFDSTASTAYSINQLDSKPQLSNYNSFNEFLRQNFKYPPIALQRNISGRVTAEFIVEPYGLATQIKILEPLAGGCNEETKRLINLMKFSPGVLNEKAVRTVYKYQLNFVHSGGQIR